MRAEIPDLPENLFRYNLDGLPETIEILDILEFCWHHVGEPIPGSFHSFFQHSHLGFDRDLGQQKFSEGVNGSSVVTASHTHLPATAKYKDWDLLSFAKNWSLLYRIQVTWSWIKY